MPHQISYEDNGRGLFVTFSGFVTGQEIVEHIHSTYERDPDHLVRWKLNDFLAADAVDISNDELRELARLRSVNMNYYPVYLVANVVEESIVRSASFIVSIHADQIEGFYSETFRTVDDARRWIVSMLDAE